MSIVDGTGLVIWERGLFEPGSDLLKRTQWAFGKIREAGGTIRLDEAGRPYGVPSDQFARTESATASGRSTVWFQWGRYLRGETPSAANPALGLLASEHTQGIAIDCDAPTPADMKLRALYFGQAGLVNTIPSESWHWAIRGPATAALDSARQLTPTTHTVQEDDMRTIKRQKSGVFYTIGQQYIKRSYDTNTSTISSYLYGDVRELNEPDFYRALSNAGIPFSEFAKADRDPKGGWSASRGVFSEEPFPAVS